MNILTISPTYDYQHGSGVGIVIKHTCERLVGKGHVCRVLTLKQDASDAADETINGVEVKRISSPQSKYLYGLSPAVYRYINSPGSWTSRDDTDVIHIHMYHNLLSFQLIFQLRNCGKPIVFTPHYNGVGHNRSARVLLTIYRPLGKEIFKHVQKVVCVSKYEAMLLQKHFGVPDSKIRIIRNGVDMKEIKSRKKEASNAPQISLLFVGRLEEFKGVQHILRAMQVLKDIYHMQPTLDIVGNGSYKNHLLKLAHNLGLEYNVIWSGVLEQKGLWPKYSAADISFLLSGAECSPLVVGEALASGTPVVVSDIRALDEFRAESGCFGIHYPPEPEKLARLIMDIHNSDVKVGPFNPAKIRTWDKAVDEYEKLYEEVCGR